jgi:hypothetical protein
MVWVCWDFGEMRVRAARHAIGASYQQSWIGERSLVGSSWTEIDRKWQIRDFQNRDPTSFVANKLVVRSRGNSFSPG